MILIQLCAPTVLIHPDKFIDSSLSSPRNKSFIHLCCMGGAREMVWFVGSPGATAISLISHKKKMKSKIAYKMESPKTQAQPEDLLFYIIQNEITQNRAQADLNRYQLRKTPIVTFFLPHVHTYTDMCTFLNTYECLLSVYPKTTYILHTHTQRKRERTRVHKSSNGTMLYFLTYCLIIHKENLEKQAL